MDENKTDLTRKERKQAYARAYYQAHREEMRRQQREYYQSIDKAAHAARVQAYREKNREHCREVQREYRKKNRERIRELDRRYRERNAAHIRENRLRYEAEHREELREKKRAYVAAHREEIRLRNQAYRATHREQRREWQRQYYQRNRSRVCRQTLEDYTFRSIQEIQECCPERVAAYLERWPFEQFAEKRIYWQIFRMGVHREDQRFDACFDAGMMAYLYSIHRCAYMGYEHVYPYIRKMIRILVICALNIYPDAERLCAENQLRLEHLEEWEGVTL